MQSIEKPAKRGSDVLAYVDGEIVSNDKATVPVLDSGLNFADGVFEGMRAYNGRVFRMDAHIKRLYHSARAFELKVGMTPEKLESEILRWLRANKVTDNFHFRPIVTRGDRFPPRVDPNFCQGPSRVIMVGGPTATVPSSGIRAVISSVRKVPSDALDATVKSINYGNCVLARLDAYRRNADDGVMLDAQGFLAEASASNVFVVSEGRLWTPWTKACLDGITRRAVMELAQAAGIDVSERDITPMQFLNADEAFLTGSGAEILPDHHHRRPEGRQRRRRARHHRHHQPLRATRPLGRDRDRGMKVTAELVQAQGEALHDYPIEAVRAGELAREIEILRASIDAVADGLSVDDEPSRYRAILIQSLPAQ